MNVLLYYPLSGILIVILAALAIKLAFHRNKKLPHEISVEDQNTLRATYSRSRTSFMIIAFLAILGWISWQSLILAEGPIAQFKPFYIFFGLIALGQLIISATTKAYKVHTNTTIKDDFKTAIIVPVYNESEASLREGIESFFIQTILPNEIHIVDDGSKHSYAKTKAWFLEKSKEYNIKASWTKQENKGKRHAHVKAIDSISSNDDMIIITIDSDGVLDPNAIEEGLKPFYDHEIASVAGVIIAKNAQTNFLSRITDLIFVSSQQLIDRAAMSRVGSVLVNSGGLAFYRSSVVHTAIQAGYLEEFFFNRPVHFSDDSFLTLFSLIQGKAVQQPTSIVFSDMPVNISHHVRQQVRWGRGSFIRSWWRLRHLSVFSFAYARQLLGWIIFVAMTAIVIEVLVVLPIFSHSYPQLELLIIPFIFGFLQSSRYFSIKRSDMSARSQIATFLLSPIATLWSTIVLRSIRIYAILTCYKTGWGTRSSVEIRQTSDDHI